MRSGSTASCPGLDRAAAALETQQLDIVVIACRGFSDRAVFLVDRAVRLDPDRPVIILADGSPAGFVRRIFELGAEDILPLPQSGEQVRFAIHKTVQRRLGSNAASGQDNARIVAVLGPKGGTGKTLTSTNLAVVLAQRGQRVILIDLDLQFGDVGLTLGLPPDTRSTTSRWRAARSMRTRSTRTSSTTPRERVPCWRRAGPTRRAASPPTCSRRSTPRCGRTTTTSWSTPLRASRPR